MWKKLREKWLAFIKMQAIIIGWYEGYLTGNEADEMIEMTFD